jgi:hypothetical protein
MRKQRQSRSHGWAESKTTRKADEGAGSEHQNRRTKNAISEELGSNNERQGTYWLHPKACLDPTFSCRRAIGRMQDLYVREAREEIQSRVSGAERQV